MANQKSFSQERIDSLRSWAAKISIPGIEQETYINILGHVLDQQDSDGFWNMDGEDWQPVMTGVVLKALALLHFKLTDRWSRLAEGYGGVEPAVTFLAKKVEDAKGDPGSGAIGEDIWDACQALLALAEYDSNSVTANAIAARINHDWEIIYATETARDSIAKWCGPAYLAAMVDVISEYEGDLGPKNNYSEAVTKLKNMEKIDANGLGYFEATTKSDDMNLWNTGLVLRTLVALPEAKIDRNQVQRIVGWILAKLQTNICNAQGGQAPMFLARSLHGLLDARPWVLDSATRDKIDSALSFGNHKLANYFSETPRRGNLKAYTAVIEYLAAWKIPAPAGLLFEAKKSLDTRAVFQAEPVMREGGLRVAWISDLHLAGERELAPGKFSLLKQIFGFCNPMQRYAESFMRFKGTPITQHFAKENLATILSHIETLKPSHILVTGDVTNYARESQFNAAHELFLKAQRAIIGTPSDTLEPSLWTVLPGNHDVTNEKPMRDITKKNLGMFFRVFGKTYDSDRSGFNYDTAFPLVKTLPGRGRKEFVRLISLDSNVRYPVWVVGVNARGRLDKKQMTRFYDIFGKPTKAVITMVALHHHPIVVPELASELEDFFLALKDTHGQKLIKACANNRVSAILHGHFHAYSSWSALTPTQQQLAVIGSPAGTITVPKTHTEEFMELCEAERETPTGGVEEGLALYKHRLATTGWIASYAGIFLPVAASP